MKANYTPTSEEVRDYYRSGAWLHAKRSPKKFNSQVCDDVYFPEFDRWLSELIRKEREEAWDEGFSLATRNTVHTPHPMAEWNPYRKEQP